MLPVGWFVIRLSERLHSNRSFLETGDIVKICHATEREDDVVIFERVSVLIEPVSDDDTSIRQIDRLNFTLKESDVA